MTERVEICWEGGSRYRAGRPGGPALLLDGSRENGLGPVDAVVAALAACSSVDVIKILEKRRARVSRVSVTVDFARASSAPRRLRGITLRWKIGSDAARKHVRGAIELSLRNYCSVAASLAPDVDIDFELELSEP